MGCLASKEQGASEGGAVAKKGKKFDDYNPELDAPPTFGIQEHYEVRV